MLRNRTSGRAGRRGRSGRSGAINMEHVFAGGLILLIVAALGLAIWHTFFRNPPMPEVDPQVYFRCVKCNNEHAIDRKDLTKEQMFQEGEPSGILDDCPKCGAKDESRQKVKCPECEKYYLPKWRVDPRGEGPNVCEHCKTDVDKWYIEDAKKRKKK